MAAMAADAGLPSLADAVLASRKRTLDMFHASEAHTLPDFPPA